MYVSTNKHSNFLQSSNPDLPGKELKDFSHFKYSRRQHNAV